MADLEILASSSPDVDKLLAGLGHPASVVSKTPDKEAFLAATETASLHLVSQQRDTYQVGADINGDGQDDGVFKVTKLPKDSNPLWRIETPWQETIELPDLFLEWESPENWQRGCYTLLGFDSNNMEGGYIGLLVREMLERARSGGKPYCLVENPVKKEVVANKATESPKNLGERLDQLLDIKKKRAQIVLLIDTSESMSSHIERTRDRIRSFMDTAIKNLPPDSKVSFGVWYYVDQTINRYKPLLSEEAMEKSSPKIEAAEAIRAVDQALYYTQRVGGSIEYTWEVLAQAVEKEPFSSSEDVEKKIFILTDERGDVGRYSFSDAMQMAEQKKIETSFSDPEMILDFRNDSELLALLLHGKMPQADVEHIKERLFERYGIADLKKNLGVGELPPVLVNMEIARFRKGDWSEKPTLVMVRIYAEKTKNSGLAENIDAISGWMERVSSAVLDHLAAGDTAGVFKILEEARLIDPSRSKALTSDPRFKGILMDEGILKAKFHLSNQCKNPENFYERNGGGKTEKWVDLLSDEDIPQYAKYCREKEEQFYLTASPSLQYRLTLAQPKWENGYRIEAGMLANLNQRYDHGFGSIGFNLPTEEMPFGGIDVGGGMFETFRFGYAGFGERLFYQRRYEPTQSLAENNLMLTLHGEVGLFPFYSTPVLRTFLVGARLDASPGLGIGIQDQWKATRWISFFAGGSIFAGASY